MRPVAFAEQNVVFGEGQPDYLPLPGHYKDGIVTTCWELSREELAVLQATGGKIWVQQITFGSPLQPQALGIEKPELL